MVSSLFLLCGSRDLNSDQQAWQQAPFLSKPTQLPLLCTFHGRTVNINKGLLMFLLCSAVHWVISHHDSFSVLPAECGWRLRLASQAARAEVTSPRSTPVLSTVEHGLSALPGSPRCLVLSFVTPAPSCSYVLEGLSREDTRTVSQMVLRDKDHRSVSEGLHLSGKRLFAPPLNNKGVE